MYRFILVEDDFHIRNGLSRFFPWNTLGFHLVESFDNGKKALDFLRVNKVDVVLTDIRMPVLDGLTLARELKKFSPDTQVIFLTAYRSFDYAKEALDCGVRNYIVKSTKYDDLLTIFSEIRKDLDNRRDADAKAEEPSREPAANNRIVRKVIASIDADLSHASLQHLADCVQLNPVYLSRLFKEKNGINFSDYLQVILAVNEKNEVLFSSSRQDMEPVEELLLSIPVSSADYTGTQRYSGQRSYVVQLYSGHGSIRYLSVTPYHSLYQTVYQFYGYILLLAFFIAILCVLISYLLSRQFYQNINQLILLFSAAERGEDLADIRPPQNLYGLLMQNITQTFVRQNMLKMQLKENEYQNQILELQSLQSQISPHFLFNTLKSIYWMSFQLTGSGNDVCCIIENMTDILDYSLNRHNEPVTLEAELRNTRNYVEIQMIRHNHQFRVDWDYPPELLSCLTLRLLLQPLVENCILHAFTWETDRNRIRIQIREKEQVVTIKIIDNGIGIPEKRLQEIRGQLKQQKDTGHIGIFNCNRRLSLTFGSAYGLDIRSREHYGTIVSLRFPCQL